MATRRPRHQRQRTSHIAAAAGPPVLSHLHIDDDEKSTSNNNAIITTILTPKNYNNDEHERMADETLAVFGDAVGFDVEQWVDREFAKHSFDKGTEIRKQLLQRKEIISQRLRSYMTTHYHKFIDNARDIVQIESSMNDLGSCLHQLGAALQKVKSVHLHTEHRFATTTTTTNNNNNNITVDGTTTSTGGASESTKPRSVTSSPRTHSLKMGDYDSGGGGGGDDEDDDDVDDDDDDDDDNDIDDDDDDDIDNTNTRNQQHVTIAATDALEDEEETEFRILMHERKYAEAAELVVHEYHESRRQQLIQAIVDDLSASGGTGGGGGGSGGYTATTTTTTTTTAATTAATTTSTSSAKSIHDRNAAIRLLVQLRSTPKAIDIYLAMCGVDVRSEMRKVDITGSVHELCRVTFTLLQRVSDDYQQLFVGSGGNHQSRAHMSSLVTWMVQQLAEFVLVFNRHVFLTEDSYRTVCTAVKDAFTLLHEHLDVPLAIVLAKRMVGPIIERTNRHFASFQPEINEELSNEDWSTTEFWVQTKAASGPKKGNRSARALRLTPSAKFFYDIVRQLLLNVVSVVSALVAHTPSLWAYHRCVVSGMQRLFGAYLESMPTAAAQSHTPLDDLQDLACIANAYFLADDLLYRVTKEFKRQFKLPNDELARFQQQLMHLYERLRHAYCEKRSLLWMNGVLKWSSFHDDDDGWRQVFAGYVGGGGGGGRVSGTFVDMCLHLKNMHERMPTKLTTEASRLIMKQCTGEFIRIIHSDAVFWQRYANEFSVEGRQQFLWDFRVLVRMVRVFVGGVGAGDDGGTMTMKAAIREIEERCGGGGGGDVDSEVLQRMTDVGLVPLSFGGGDQVKQEVQPE